MIKFLIIIILLIIFLVHEYHSKKFEYLISNNYFDVHIISLKNKDRIENIKKQLSNFEIFDAVNGSFIDQNNLINDKILSSDFKFDSKTRSKEIACYLSHIKLLEHIKKNSFYDFSLVLEDDFLITEQNFEYILNDIIKNNTQGKIDFDIIFLGNMNDNHKNVVYKNIYEFNETQNLWGSYAYLVNKKSIDKIINLIKFIEKPIDIKYEELARNKSLLIYTFFPTIISSNYNLLSTILN